MPLLFKTGDVLLADETNHILVHCCNCRGIMGGGIAKQIKLIYPKAYNAYRNRYEKSGLRLGEIQTIKIDTIYNMNCVAIINAMGQQDIGSGVQISYNALATCIEKILELANKFNFNDVVSPFIGTGLAGGSKDKVEKILIDSLKKYPLITWTVYLFEG